jgi:hypothetical protein
LASEIDSIARACELGDIADCPIFSHFDAATMAKGNPLEDAIAASNAASAASKFLSRVLEREKAGKLTPDEVRDQGAEAIAMILDAAERMRAAVIAYHSGNPRKTGF